MGNQNRQIQSDLLVLRCQEGNMAAFNSLVIAWQERLWLHARRLTGDEDAAYDILQDTWMAIARGLGRLRDPAAFPGWAYRIVSNKSRDWIRKRSRQRAGLKSYSEMWAAESHPSSIHEDARYQSLRQALAHLAGPDLALLALKYDEGFDTSQIAETLSIPEGTVRSRLYYLRNKIRNAMKED